MKRKCENRLCDNLSRRFENKFCSILCADTHDGIIPEFEWVLVNPYSAWIKSKEGNYLREKHLNEIYELLKRLKYY